MSTPAPMISELARQRASAFTARPRELFIAGGFRPAQSGETFEVVDPASERVFSEALGKARVPALDLAARYGEVGEALLPLLNAATVPKYGLEFASFILENVSVPPEVEQAIDKRSSMAAVGNLNDYVKFQMAQGLGQGSGGGAAGSAAEIAMGFGMAQQMMKEGFLSGQSTPAAAAPAAPAAAGGAAPALMSPAQAAQQLGVSEQDVIATLESGELKGKKIGTQWRITSEALNEFLKH